MTLEDTAAIRAELNNEGFFVDPGQWDESMVPELARREGITELTDARLEGHSLHARRVPQQGEWTHRPRAGKDVGSLRQGAL